MHLVMFHCIKNVCICITVSTSKIWLHIDTELTVTTTTCRNAMQTIPATRTHTLVTHWFTEVRLQLHLITFNKSAGAGCKSVGMGTSVLPSNCHPQEVASVTDVIPSATATADEVASAGTKLLVLLYGGQISDNLNRLRFAKYMQKIPTSPVLPENLPPTERAAFYHSLRVHLQVMQWAALNTSVTDAMGCTEYICH